SQKQKVFAEEIDAIMRIEAVNEVNFFWNRKPLYISVRTIGEYMTLAVQALNLQMSHDPQNTAHRSKKLLKVVNEMLNVAESEEPITHGDVTILEPVVYAIHVDDIAARLENLDEALIALYEETTRKYKEILGRV
ncbi:MAG: hypothetical protein AABX98_02855, partial [Nanoarchaeota archaeon]